MWVGFYVSIQLVRFLILIPLLEDASFSSQRNNKEFTERWAQGRCSGVLLQVTTYVTMLLSQ
jgi:hypothetical protein